MKVGELIELLQTMDAERVVIMSADSEGNRYSPLSEMYNGGYIATNDYSGEAMGTSELTKELEVQGYNEGHIQRAIILYPKN